MNCRLADLRDKDVICIKDGTRLGCVGDVEVDVVSGCLTAIIIYGRFRFFGFFGGTGDIVIKWCDIEVIGEDTILVRCEPSHRRKRGRFFAGE